MSRQNGVALIQVLLISTILSIFALQINQTSKQQVELAKGFIDKSDALVKMRAARAQLFYAMSTERRIPNRTSEQKIPQLWNFYGQPFKLENGVTITIQDIGGLLSISQQGPLTFKALFEHFDVPEREAETFFASLQDWQDEDSLSRLNGAEADYYEELGLRPPRNGKIQFLEEVENIRGMTPQLWNKIKPLLTNEYLRQFNPYTAPYDVIAVKYGEATADNVAELRASNFEYSTSQFSQITGIYLGDSETFYPGIYQKVTLEYGEGEDKVKEYISVKALRNSQDIFQVILRSEY